MRQRLRQRASGRLPTGLRLRSLGALLAVTVCCGRPLPAQTPAPQLSGTWKLRQGASQIDPEIVFAGLGGNARVPGTLYVTQARNGTVVIGSDMNTSHARTYRPGATTSTTLDGVAIETMARWEEGTLVVEGHDATSAKSLGERFTVDSDRGTLTVAITISTAGTEKTAKLVYASASSESPCQQWPTPCKDWSAQAAP